MLASSGTNWVAIIAMLSILPRVASNDSRQIGNVESAGVDVMDKLEEAFNGT